MWSWLKGERKDGSTTEPPHPSIESASAAAETKPSTAVVKTTQTQNNKTQAKKTTSTSTTPYVHQTSPEGSSPPDGVTFWGFTEAEDVSADRDLALDDIMAFFGFAHMEHKSDYVGCVSFELTYPDGRKAIRTVEILPKSKAASIEIEEEKEEDTNQPTPTARVIRYDEPSTPPSTLDLIKARVGYFASLLPSPSFTLLQPRHHHHHHSEHTDSTSSTTAASTSSVANNEPPLPTMPFSSRVRIHSGPVPPDVHPTARLLCPRAIFFDVYLGRLDPIKSVLTGKAHCPGFRYYELLHFGQSFEMNPQKWIDFYAKQAEVEAERKRRGLIKEDKGGGSHNGGNSGSGNGSLPQLPPPSSSTSSTPATNGPRTSTTSSFFTRFFHPFLSRVECAPSLPLTSTSITPPSHRLHTLTPSWMRPMMNRVTRVDQLSTNNYSSMNATDSTSFISHTLDRLNAAAFMTMLHE